MITDSVEFRRLAAKLKPSAVAEQLLSVQPMFKELPHVHIISSQPFEIEIPQNESSS